MREALTFIQLGEAEALAGGIVAKLRQETLLGRANRSERLESSQGWL